MEENDSIEVETINDRLQKLVNEKTNGNRSEFCRKLGLENFSLNNFLGSRKSKPSVDFLCKVIKRFNVDPYWLLFGEASPSGAHHNSTFGDKSPIAAGRDVIYNDSDMELLRQIIQLKDEIITELRSRLSLYEKLC